MAADFVSLFRGSWLRTAATLGALASTMALVAAGFRYVSRDAVQHTGYCATPVPDGADVYCVLGETLARIAGGLVIGAILIAGAAFWATWKWWLQGRPGSNSGN